LPVLGGTRRKLLSAEDVVGAVAPSSDGRKIAFSRYNAASGMSSLMIANADGSGLSALATGLPAALGAGPISWSPDGKMIAELFRTGPVFVPANGGASRTMSLPGWKLIQNVAWLPSGKGLLVTAERDTAGVTAHHHVLEVSYPEGRVRRVTNDLSDHPTSALPRMRLLSRWSTLSIHQASGLLPPAIPTKRNALMAAALMDSAEQHGPPMEGLCTQMKLVSGG
jgi:hypothetical protein